MIGAHELSIIIRMQNYASSPLRRLSGDLARLQKQRDLQGRHAQLQVRAAQQQLRLSQLDANTGTKGIALQNARLRISNQIKTVQERQSALQDRQISLAGKHENLDLQRLKLENQILAVEERQTAAIKTQQGVLEKNKATQASMALGIKGQRSSMGTFLPNVAPGLARQAADLATHRAETARIIAERRLTATKAAGADTMIPERRLREAEMAKSLATGKVKEMDVALKQLQRTEQEEISTLARLNGQANQYGRRVAELNAQIKLLTYGEEALNASERTLIATSNGLSRNLAILEGQLKGVAAAELENAQSAKIMAAQLAMTEADVVALGASANAMKADKLKNTAQVISSIGRAAQMSGLMATAAFGLAAASAAKLNTQAVLAGSQMSQSADAMVANGAKIQSAIVETMAKGTSSSEDLSASIYDIFSSTNIRSLQTGTKFLKLMSDVAIAGQTNVQDATKLTIQVLNNFGGPVRQRVEQMFSAVRYGAITFEQYSQSLSQLIPAFKGAGQGFGELNAAFAQSTRQLGPSFARSGLARLVEIFQRKAFQQGIKNFGFSITDATGKLIPFHDIITKIAEKFPKIAKGQQGVQEFVRLITSAGGAPAGQGGTLQAARVAQVLIDRYKDYNSLVKDVTGNTKQFTNQLKAMENTTGVKWAEFVNQLKALVLVIGAAAIPVFIQLGKVITPIVKFFQNHPTVAKWVGIIGAATAVVLLFVGSLAVLLGALGTIAAAFGTASAAVVLFTADVGAALALGVGIGMLLNKIPGVGRAEKWLGGKIFDWTHDKPDLHIGDLKKQVDAVEKEYNRLRGLGMDKKALRTTIMPARMKQLFPDINEHDLQVFIKHAQDKYNRALARGSHDLPLPSIQGPKTLFAGTGLFNNAQFLAAEKQADRLRRAVEKAPNMAAAMAAQIKYQNFQAAMGEKMTKAQKDAQQAVEQFLQNQPVLSDAAFSKQYKNVQRLFSLASSGKGIEAWKQYYKAAEDLSKDASQTQMAWAEKVFGQIEKQATLTNAQAASKTANLTGLQHQFTITPTIQGAEAITKLQKQLEALTPAQQMFFDAVNANMKFLSDQAAVSALAQVTRLKDAFDKAPTLANWQAWFDANKAFTKNFTQDQQQAAQDIEAAHKAATDKIKQDYASLLDKVRSTFSEIRSQNASSFGTLGSGPVTKGLSNRVDQIKSAADAQSAAIRASGDSRAKALNDQADRIQAAFDSAVNSIDARSGDLIDWGLMANPEVQRSSVEAQVQALHHQADEITKAAGESADKVEKNAAARADRLAKRLAEHKLTGNEIVADLQAQVKAFTNWNNDLNAIAKKGGPSALVEQLRALGPEFDPMLKSIRNMSPELFAKYVKIFNQGQKAIDKASLAATAERLKKEFPLYVQQGKNISDWLAQGVQENPALKNAFIKIMNDVFKGSVNAPTTSKPARRTLASAKTSQSGPHVTHNNTYNYNAGKGMDYSTWMKKNHFRQRNHRKC